RRHNGNVHLRARWESDEVSQLRGTPGDGVYDEAGRRPDLLDLPSLITSRNSGTPPCASWSLPIKPATSNYCPTNNGCADLYNTSPPTRTQRSHPRVPRSLPLSKCSLSRRPAMVQTKGKSLILVLASIGTIMLVGQPLVGQDKSKHRPLRLDPPN